MRAYYNEIDPYAAEWLRTLITFGLIAHGDVDERSILDVTPADLRGYTQCHFFAGIGVWSYALRRAGWRDDAQVWTGSCPCQPFSAAGKGEGFADERHLWPHFHYLIEQCQPRVVFGEQVASSDGLSWLDLVQADLEATGYAVAPVDICAAGVGAPHIRQRLWFVAERLEHAESDGRDERWAEPSRRGAAGGCGVVGLDDDDDPRLEGQRGGYSAEGGHGQGAVRPIAATGEPGRVAGADGGHACAEGLQRGGQHGLQPQGSGVIEVGLPGPTNGFWRDADWIRCRDGKWRPVEPGTFPLAHGAPARVGRLRAYGNAIVAQAAEEVIRAYMDVRGIE